MSALPPPLAPPPAFALFPAALGQPPALTAALLRRQPRSRRLCPLGSAAAPGEGLPSHVPLDARPQPEPRRCEGRGQGWFPHISCLTLERVSNLEQPTFEEARSHHYEKRNCSGTGSVLPVSTQLGEREGTCRDLDVGVADALSPNLMSSHRELSARAC